MTHQVIELNIYPIKGMRGTKLSSALAQDIGFRYDRQWMLINADGKFISQRTHPQMALFIPIIVDNKVVLSYEGAETSFGIDEHLPGLITAQVWDDVAETVEVSVSVNQWISMRLGTEVRLVKLASAQSRSHTSSLTLETFSVSLADGYPYLIIGSASLQQLNTNLTEQVTMDRFRPSIVIETQVAHEEDDWTEIQVGNLVFQNVKTCGRCTVITIDQQSAVVNKEPLSVLNKYRKSGNSVLFGSYYICTQLGEVTVGDQVIVRSEK